jgi:hypothetical protein
MKPIVAAAIPLLAALESYLATGQWNVEQTAVAITGVVTAVVVYFVPNQNAGVLAAAKAISAAAVPLVSALIQWGVTGGAPVATALIGFATAVLMYFVQPAPNTE